MSIRISRRVNGAFPVGVSLKAGTDPREGLELGDGQGSKPQSPFGERSNPLLGNPFFFGEPATPYGGKNVCAHKNAQYSYWDLPYNLVQTPSGAFH